MLPVNFDRVSAEPPRQRKWEASGGPKPAVDRSADTAQVQRARRGKTVPWIGAQTPPRAPGRRPLSHNVSISGRQAEGRSSPSIGARTPPRWGVRSTVRRYRRAERRATDRGPLGKCRLTPTALTLAAPTLILTFALIPCSGKMYKSEAGGGETGYRETERGDPQNRPCDAR